jgi:hypothetical protein
MRDLCTIVILPSKGFANAPTVGKSVLNRSYIMHKLPLSVPYIGSGDITAALIPKSQQAKAQVIT